MILSQGDLFAILAGFFWSFSVILMRIAGFKIGPNPLTFFKNVVAILCFLLVMLIMGIPFLPEIPLSDYGRLAISGILGITIADTHGARLVPHHIAGVAHGLPLSGGNSRVRTHCFAWQTKRNTASGISAKRDVERNDPHGHSWPLSRHPLLVPRLQIQSGRPGSDLQSALHRLYHCVSLLLFERTDDYKKVRWTPTCDYRSAVCRSAFVSLVEPLNLGVLTQIPRDSVGLKGREILARGFSLGYSNQILELRPERSQEAARFGLHSRDLSGRFLPIGFPRG